MRYVLLFALCFTLSTNVASAADPLTAPIRTDDVDLFYRVFDAAKGQPSAQQIKSGYLDVASPGVADFIPMRIKSAQALADRVVEAPEVYRNARICRAVLPAVERRIRATYLAFQAVYPEFSSPPATILIGRNNSGGTVKDSGVLVGLEVVCREDAATTASSLPIDVRLSHLIAHELVHTQQKGFASDTLLASALNEGIADFIGELISGETSNRHLKNWTAGREAEFEAAFATDMRGKDLNRWIYNGIGTPEAPGDLAYWVGYRIAKSFYDRAADKRAAVRTMLTSTDPEAFLAISGWTPAKR